MLHSMTAYGRAKVDTSFGHLVVELQSVNRKYLEVNVILPKELGRFETDVRRWLSAVLHRGQVTVRVNATYEQRTPVKIVPNIPLAIELKNAWNQVGEAVGAKTPFSLELLAKESNLFSYEDSMEDEEIYRASLKRGVDESLQPFLAMRQREGNFLAVDILSRIAHMREQVRQIRSWAADAPSKYREKLAAALEQALPGAENEERLLREVMLFADRVDVTEELTRASSHLDQLESAIRTGGTPIGKTLEFLLQELLREANTMASKSIQTEVSYAVVELKGEIERIREQVQNIE